MLIMLTFINTLPKKRQKNEDFDELSQLRTTIEKNRKKRKSFQNKRVSSQNIRMRKEEGATVAATPYLLSAGRFEFSSGRTGSVLQRTPMTVGKGHKLLKMSY